MAAPIVGYFAKVTANGSLSPFIAASYEIRGMGDDLDWSNFVDSFVAAGPNAGNGYRRRRVGLQESEITLRQATWDNQDGRNPFGAPHFFRINRNVTLLKIFPLRTDPDRFFHFPLVICTAYNASGDVQSLQPFDVTFKTDGHWFMPGDV